MTKCKNCGHNSHCGVSYMKEETNELGESHQVEVCKNCRCNNCEVKTDWG